MAKQLLPNGSVVTLKGATKKLMTIGIEVEMEGDEKTYDYIAIPYPEGYIDSETMFLFMQEDIENVSFVGFVDAQLQVFRTAVKVGEGVVKIAGAVALVAGSGGAALPVATCLALSAGNDVYNAMMDATYTYTGDFNKIGNTNLLKEFLVKQGRETGEALFGDKKLGETMGNWVYTGLDIVSFLNGVDQLGKSFGKFQTAITGTAGTSKVWGEIHMKDVIENTHKLYKKDGIIKTVLRIDPTSVGNFGYDVVTGAMKAIQSAGKLGSTIADLAFG